MAKKRKTREQKKLADLRHNFTHDQMSKAIPSTKIKLPTKEIVLPLEKTKSSNSTNLYSYLIKDLSKTGLLTTAILTIQIILFSLLKNHTLKIPGLNY